MKVKELQEKLASLDPELQLICSSEDEEMLADNELFKLFEVLDVNVVNAERMRDAYRKPTLKIGDSEYSMPIVIVNISNDF
ncbi:hypothetical protein [Vibrio sp. EA2]|uniref:hypothetical protein n=1 Tax=Vibrio sp. EA2 TaxID=3079860 RepID=UPI00294A49C1|nr:hypothetical protein [Vibrio sp. EA2]MDV6251059.1 hypothetical protein [Vibrio sp. EA2]